MATSEGTLARSGSTSHYWLSGPEGAPLLTFTHGATMDHRMFASQVEAFSNTYRVLTWDVRGHGKSQPIGDAFSIAAVAEDLLALLDAAGYERAVFIGQSMGAYVGQSAILQQPDRALAYVSIGSTSITRRYSMLDRIGLALTPPSLRLWPYENLKRLIARSTAVTDEARAYAYEAVSQVRQADYARVMDAVARSLQYVEAYRMPVPALLTHGDQDNTGRIKAYAQQWADEQPNAEYVIIPNAGHNANQDNPEFFNRVLSDFLQRHVPA